MASSIRVISTSKVCAANHKEPNPRIDLTPWDLQLLLLDTIQKGLVFHKPKHDDPHHENLIHHLQTSLSRTLDFFLPLAGRLATVEHEDETTSFFIDCNNTGAEFVHAIADGVSVSDIIEQTYVPDHIVYSFFPLNGIRNYGGTSNPLLAVQVTELVDCIFIGCTINHTVLDGTSFWHFFNSWSEISRGLDSLSKPPVLERWFLHDTDCPILIPSFKKEQLHSKFVPPPLQQRVFHFTAESIAKLKEISSLQALLSHIWRSAVRIKRIDPDQETSFKIAIGVRQRLQPLHQQYLGNAIQVGFITMKAGKRCTTSDLNNCHSTNSGIRAQESQKFEEQRQKPNLPRIQSAQNKILSTPECSNRRKECTGENFTQIGATERPHAPPEVGEYRHAPPTRSHSLRRVTTTRQSSSSPELQDPTRRPTRSPTQSPTRSPVARSDPEIRPVPRSDPDCQPGPSA
ncbi:hypothetical protein LWI29_016803 [Acer saccharum]|uniref:Uncharacterized protein n=1 Tax=Acer saccharum TaxID=4024 RepID=A0AA39VZR1_ACESA|nr:hypothetical protein LWI29_016803 [Acer saccharum]